MLYRDRKPLLVFILPAFALMIWMLYYPFILNIYNSFFEIKGLASNPGEYLGFSNYARIFQDTFARTSIVNSLKMMVLSVIFQVGLALVLALMVDSIKRGQQFFRTVFFFPIVVSATAIGLMFNLFYDFYNGMLNQLITSMGGDRINWLSEQNAFGMIAIPVIWQYVGFYFVIILTGLASVPDELYEAASIDGATRLQSTWYITLPMISDVLITAITLSITGALKVFDLPAIIAVNGAPKGLTWFLGTYMHNQAFVAGDVDYGSALSVIIVILGVVISRGANAILSRFSQVRQGKEE